MGKFRTKYVSPIGLATYKSRRRCRDLMNHRGAWTQIRVNRFARRPIRIVVGASGDSFSGWITTEKFFFDITDRRSTSALIGGAKVRSFLLEHVLEHLSYEHATEAIKNLLRYVAAGGTIRIAVPDGNHPDEKYRRLVGVGGPDDHLHLWTSADAVVLARESKCALEMVEYFTEGGQFVSTHLSDSETIAEDRGLVSRSAKNSWSRADSKDYGPFGYTSLIFDLVADPLTTSGTATDL